MNNNRKQVRVFLDLETLDRCQRVRAINGLNLSDLVQISLNQYLAQEAHEQPCDTNQ